MKGGSVDSNPHYLSLITLTTLGYLGIAGLAIARFRTDEDTWLIVHAIAIAVGGACAFAIGSYMLGALAIMLFLYGLWEIHRYVQKRRAKASENATTAAPQGRGEGIETAPDGAHVDRRNAMRKTIGYIVTPIAALMWILTIIALCVRFFAPQTFLDAQVPGIAATVSDVLRDLKMPFFLALIFTNGVAAWAAPPSMRVLDRYATRIGLAGVTLITLAVLGMSLFGGHELTANEFFDLCTILAFGVLDHLYNQGVLAYANDNTPVESNDNAPAAVAPRTARPAPVEDGLLKAFADRGLTRIGPLMHEALIINVAPNGRFAFEVPTLNEMRLLALAGEQISGRPLSPPPEAAAA